MKRASTSFCTAVQSMCHDVHSNFHQREQYTQERGEVPLLTKEDINIQMTVPSKRGASQLKPIRPATKS